MFIEKAAYNNLQINKIIKLISSRCRSEIGVLVAENMIPAADISELRTRQSLFIDVENFRAKKGELPWANNISSVAFMLETAEEQGVLTGEELVKIRTLLNVAEQVKKVLYDSKNEYENFSILLRSMRDFSKEIEMLSVVDDDGRLYDYASEKLSATRLEMREVKEQIRRKAHNMLNDASITQMLQEKVLSMRSGRYAFLVRQDSLSIFPGAVIERSGSGNSVYMEPRSLMALNNEYSKLYGEEMLEEMRLFREFTAKLISRKKGILDTENVLGTIDLFFSLSELIRIKKWHMPKISDNKCFSFNSARHPLLGENAVPIDIKCGDKFRILVITGPNTGGKTLALKTAGICLYFGWMGWPIPVAGNSIIGNIDEIFADIGDEQSIEQNLSTFSGHINHVKEIFEKITSNSLVMLDELGAGTDPEEGAALGIAMLDWLKERGTLVLATTHHNPIKRYALVNDGIETASVEFNSSTLSPTYKILIGIPGRSNALLIAGKLGLKKEIIKRAERAINSREISMEDLIGELHEKRAGLERKISEVEASRAKLDKLEKNYEKKIKEIEDKKEALIASADKKAISIVRNAEDSARALIKNMANAQAEPEARRELEKKRSHFQKIENTAIKREEKKQTAQSVVAENRQLKIGDTVQLLGTEKCGEVIELRGKKALIRAGIAEIEVPLTKLKISNKKAVEVPVTVNVKISRPVGVPSELMIRMMTVDEAMPIVEQYLDKAYCAGYDVVRVIHGHGEGILRREVQALCKRLPYVVEHNLGGPHEGGWGVTVVKFKK